MIKNRLKAEVCGLITGVNGIIALERMLTFVNLNILDIQRKIVENQELNKAFDSVDYNTLKYVTCLAPGMLFGSLAGISAALSIYYATRQEKKE